MDTRKHQHQQQAMPMDLRRTLSLPPIHTSVNNQILFSSDRTSDNSQGFTRLEMRSRRASLPSLKTIYPRPLTITTCTLPVHHKVIRSQHVTNNISGVVSNSKLRKPHKTIRTYNSQNVCHVSSVSRFLNNCQPQSSVHEAKWKDKQEVTSHPYNIERRRNSGPSGSSLDCLIAAIDMIQTENVKEH